MSYLAKSLFVCIVYILMLQNTISLPAAVWPPLEPEHKVSEIAIYQSLRRRATMAMRDQTTHSDVQDGFPTIALLVVVAVF